MADVLDQAALKRWRREPTAFIEEVLRDPETNRPFRLLPAERTFLQHAFKLNEQGRLRYPEQLYSCPKKSGKSCSGALHLLVMVLVFGGRYAEAYALANDLEQAQGRVFAACRRIVEASPLLRREAKVSANKIEFFGTGATITAVGSDYASAAGANPTISVFDELWAYTSERSRRLFDEMIPPPTRKLACRLTVTYAGFEGESELLEEMYKRALSQPEIGNDLRAGDGLLAFWSHSVIAPWQTDEWLNDMKRALRPNQYARMILNKFSSSEENFVEMAWWDSCTTGQPVVADRSLPVWIGVDASTKRDSTAIVAVTWDREVKKVRLINHRIFHPSPNDPINFARDIEETILDYARRFKVKAVVYDPYAMAASAQRLSKAGVKMEEYPQSLSGLTATTQNLFELVKGGGLIVYPDAEIRTAVSHAVALESTRGWRLTKGATSHKIDVVVALSLACLAAVRKGEVPRMRVGYMPKGIGRVIWKDDKPEPTVVKFVRVDEHGNTLTPEQSRAIRNSLPGRMSRS